MSSGWTGRLEKLSRLALSQTAEPDSSLEMRWRRGGRCRLLLRQQRWLARPGNGMSVWSSGMGAAGEESTWKSD